MNIKKFEIEYGGFGFSDGISLQENTLVYSSWDVHNYNHSFKEVRITPTKEEWTSFFEAIKLITWDWRRKYVLDVCDGASWSVKIQADGFKLNSGGLHLFPENFDEFLLHVRRLIGREDFASDFGPDDFMSCTLVPHFVNRRIRRWMRKKKIKMTEMAARLRLDLKELRQLLESPVTFEIEYLQFISHILSVSMTELLYESTLDEEPKRSKKFVLTPDNLEFLSSKLDPERLKAILKKMLNEGRTRN